MIFNQIIQLFKKQYQPLNRIKVLPENIIYNYRYLSSLEKNLQVAPVVKSNGYGHGIGLIGKIVDHLNAPFLCVDSLYEAYELLKAGIKTKILIMGYTDPQNFTYKKLPFSYVVYDLETAQILNQHQKGAGIHIFVNTGMNREGVSLSQLPTLLNELKKLSNIQIEGLMSHLSSSESDTDKLFLNQVDQFKKAQEIFKKHKISPKWIHLAASGAITNPQTRPIIAKISNLTRAGLSLYGYDPHYHHVIPAPASTRFRRGGRGEQAGIQLKRKPEDESNIFLDPHIHEDDNIQKLKPALRLISKVVQIKPIKKGEKVGYDGTFVTKKDMVIGILPIGYNDGVDRKLSNQGVVLVNGISCKILGKVSMNITTIDLTNVPNPQNGSEAIIYSDNPSDANSISNCAKLCDIIPYELLIHLNPTIKRTLI